MSEVQTSPAPAVSAAPTSPAPTSGTGEAGPVGASAEESASPPEDLAGTSEAEEGSEASVAAPATEPIEEKPTLSALSDFDPSTWEGNIDLLPTELQEPVRFLHRNLESGYTKKFQDLSTQRKEFDAAKEAWEASKTDHASSIKEIEEERNMLRQLLEGAEDPRIGEFLTLNEKLKADLEAVQGEYNKYKSAVQYDIEEQARKYAENFRGQHSEIFDSDEKRTQLGTLLDAGWDPEAAVRLVGGDEKLIQMANTLKQQGVPAKVAVEHAMLKMGTGEAKRTPRPGARITAGAEGRNNPASVSGSSARYANTNREARATAAHEALLWAAQRRNKS